MDTYYIILRVFLQHILSLAVISGLIFIHRMKTVSLNGKMEEVKFFVQARVWVSLLPHSLAMTASVNLVVNTITRAHVH